MPRGAKGHRTAANPYRGSNGEGKELARQGYRTKDDLRERGASYGSKGKKKNGGKGRSLRGRSSGSPEARSLRNRIAHIDAIGRSRRLTNEEQRAKAILKKQLKVYEEGSWWS